MVEGNLGGLSDTGQATRQARRSQGVTWELRRESLVEADDLMRDPVGPAEIACRTRVQGQVLPAHSDCWNRTFPLPAVPPGSFACRAARADPESTTVEIVLHYRRIR